MDIDVEAIENAIRGFMVADSDIRRYSNFVKTGDYEMPSRNGIDIFIRGGIPKEAVDGVALFASTYVIPMDIQILCGYRNRDDLSDNLSKLCTTIALLISRNGKIAGTNGYSLPIEFSEEMLGDGDNPTMYIVTMTVNYRMILIPA